MGFRGALLYSIRSLTRFGWVFVPCKWDLEGKVQRMRNQVSLVKKKLPKKLPPTFSGWPPGPSYPRTHPVHYFSYDGPLFGTLLYDCLLATSIVCLSLFSLLQAAYCRVNFLWDYWRDFWGESHCNMGQGRWVFWSESHVLMRFVASIWDPVPFVASIWDPVPLVVESSHLYGIQSHTCWWDL